jgi:hypothetical protein
MKKDEKQNIREDIRLTSTSPTSPRYESDSTEETYVRSVYDTRPVRHDLKEIEESSSSSQRSTAGSTPASQKRKASPRDDMSDVRDVSLLSPPPKAHEVIDLRSPHSSWKVSARGQAE